MSNDQGGKGDRDRSDSEKYRHNYDKIDYSKPVSTKGFKVTVNGKEIVEKDVIKTNGCILAFAGSSLLGIKADSFILYRITHPAY